MVQEFSTRGRHPQRKRHPLGGNRGASLQRARGAGLAKLVSAAASPGAVATLLLPSRCHPTDDRIAIADGRRRCPQSPRLLNTLPMAQCSPRPKDIQGGDWWRRQDDQDCRPNQNESSFRPMRGLAAQARTELAPAAGRTMHHRPRPRPHKGTGSPFAGCGGAESRP